MEHARPPAELSLEGGPAMRSESWRKWRKLFEVFLKASGVSKEAKDVQASLLVNLIGPAGYEAYTTFTYQKGEKELTSKTIQICQVAELSKEESLCIDGSGDSAQVNAMSASGSYRERGRFRTGGRWRRGDGGRGYRGIRGGVGGAMGAWPRSEAAGRDVCANCGSARCTAGDKCPARYAKFFVCDQMGHYSK
ncbi:hypothetical protein ACJJTC_010626 [Scirpophaga incertulas]